LKSVVFDGVALYITPLYTQRSAHKGGYFMTENKQPISRDTALRELVEKFPEAAMLMASRGLHCLGCHMAALETIEQGCQAHGMSDKEIDELVDEMNHAVKKK
jgi:hybrid cluster-associated redox disulfide protein